MVLILVLPVLLFSSSRIGGAHVTGKAHVVSFVGTSWLGFTIVATDGAGVVTLGPNTDVLLSCVKIVSGATGQHTVYMRGRVPLFDNAPTTFVLNARTGISSVRWDQYGFIGSGPCQTASVGYIHTGVAVVAP
jgi:hypothetical protein